MDHASPSGFKLRLTILITAVIAALPVDPPDRRMRQAFETKLDRTSPCCYSCTGSRGLCFFRREDRRNGDGNLRTARGASRGRD